MTYSRFQRSETVAEGTLAFHFERPRGFLFQAAQNVLVTLGGGWENRTFTVASAPHEPASMIATRMRTSRPAVFIAGGIGITPFLSMQHANRRASGAAFLAEEEGGEPIGESLVRRHVPDLAAPVYYLAGPPGMTMDVQGMLAGLGVIPDDIRSEEFYGY